LPAADTARPLAGVRIIVTRAEEQARELFRKLKQLGAEVMALPAIAFAEPEDFGPLDSAIGDLSTFDWIFFTSANAVRFFSSRCSDRCAELRGPKIGVVGPATESAAMHAGFTIDFVAKEFRAESLVKGLQSQLEGKRVLLPRSDRASKELPEALTAAGASVTEVVTYRTIEPLPQVKSDWCYRSVRSAGECGVISFFSPSAFRATLDSAGQALLASVTIAAIGPVTAAAIRAAGFTVAIEAREATTVGFIAALVEHFASKASQGVRT
jgi:uroporphyrinogen III methyltransferase / synthase